MIDFSVRGIRRCREAFSVLVISGLGVWAGTVRADNGNNQPLGTSPGAAWPTPVLPETNAASSTFLQSHPELDQPSSSDPTLSLHPEASLPEPNSPGPENTPPVPHFAFPEGEPEALADHLLVVYNSKDPDSQALANYYATRRKIPPERVLGIACPTTEEITRAQYEATVREPIISYIYQKNWMSRRSVPVQIGSRSMDLLIATQNNIWAMVLMRGIPLKIAQDNTLQGGIESAPSLQSNAAAVDSELAVLPVFGLPLGGFLPNIFFDQMGTGLVRVGPELATKLILVTRLDGPRPADVRRMIDDTLYAEENRLAGLAVVDSRGITDINDKYMEGDVWLRLSHDLLLQGGWSMDFDTSQDVLPPSDPCNHVAFYLGWYHDGAYGPWVTPPDRFVRGAIAYHLHSFSAFTVRSATAGWVGPLIAHGATATMGNVYEPYLDLTPHLNIFTARLLEGDYFSEAAYASQRGLSWMLTVVGDPLYRPFKKPLDAALAGAGPPNSDHYDWLLLQKTHLGLNSGQIVDSSPSLKRQLDIPGGVAQEGLGDLLEILSNHESARQAYRMAGTLDTLPIDRIRVGLKLAQDEENNGKLAQAEAEFRALRREYPVEAGRFAVPAPVTAAAAPGTGQSTGRKLVESARAAAAANGSKAAAP